MSDATDDQADVEEQIDGTVDGEVVDQGPPVWSSDAELDLADARRLTSQRGTNMVMFLGESGVGKTTLLAELWTDLLLQGSLGGLRFGGSCTSIPFEQRAFQSRMESGVLNGYTLKTYEEDDGFLHLRVGSDERVVDLLLSDFAGEHFVRVREGTPLAEELDWTWRVDKFAVVLDGKAMVTPGEREVAITRTERLLLALQTSTEVHPTSSLRLVVAKDDVAIEPGQRQVLDEAVDRLCEVARSVDEGATGILVAARPALGTEPYGLDQLLDWLSADASGPGPTPIPTVVPARAFGRFR